MSAFAILCVGFSISFEAGARSLFPFATAAELLAGHASSSSLITSLLLNEPHFQRAFIIAQNRTVKPLDGVQVQRTLCARGLDRNQNEFPIGQTPLIRLEELMNRVKLFEAALGFLSEITQKPLGALNAVDLHRVIRLLAARAFLMDAEGLPQEISYFNISGQLQFDHLKPSKPTAEDLRGIWDKKSERSFSQLESGMNAQLERVSSLGELIQIDLQSKLPMSLSLIKDFMLAYTEASRMLYRMYVRAENQTQLEVVEGRAWTLNIYEVGVNPWKNLNWQEPGKAEFHEVKEEFHKSRRVGRAIYLSTRLPD